MPVPVVEEKQNVDLDYKLIFAIGSFDRGKAQVLSDALNEVARSINLHASAGIPKANIHAVVIVMRQGLNVLLKDETYKEKFNSSNPNITLIQELQNAGVKFITCGQSMARLEIPKENLIPGSKVALSARTAFSQYEMMGYVQ